MQYEGVIQLTSEAMMLCLLLSAPAVLVSVIVGLTVSFVQAVTSLQDQAISQGIKLLCVTVVVVMSAPWAGATLMHFSQRLLAAAVA